MTVDLFLVRHAESCSNISRTKLNTYRRTHKDILHEPVLSVTGYIQSFLLRQELPKIGHFDKVICSPLVRTVLTSMISLATFNSEVNRSVIHIVPYVKFHTKKLSKINSAAELKEKIHGFNRWFHTTGIHMYQLFRDLHPISPKEVTAIHFPRIDFTLLEDYERSVRENERINVIQEFQNYISSDHSHTSSWLVFTHKRFIMGMNRTLQVPKNTSITKLVVDVTNDNTPQFEIKSSKVIYTPRIRTLKIDRSAEDEMCKNAKSFLSKTRKRRR
jgi:phosphohistidine phosphatase SixA